MPTLCPPYTTANRDVLVKCNRYVKRFYANKSSLDAQVDEHTSMDQDALHVFVFQNRILHLKFISDILLSLKSVTNQLVCLVSLAVGRYTYNASKPRFCPFCPSVCPVTVQLVEHSVFHMSHSLVAKEGAG